MIKSLQTLRFVFALMIFHHHFFTSPQIAQFGTFPVTFFFILSGYVMAIGYENKVCLPSFSYASYMKKRLVRIIPLNLLCLIMVIIFPILGDIVHLQLHPTTYVFWLLDALLLQSWIPVQAIYFSGNAVAWFLSSMLFCYLLFPFLLKWLKGRHGTLLMIAVMIVYFVVVPFIEEKYVHALIYINPLFRVVDFMMGIYLYHGIKRITIEKTNAILATILEVFAIGISVGALIIYSSVSERYGFASLYWPPSILLILTFSLSEKMGGGLSNLFKNSVLVQLGTMSFPFYMMHQIIISWYHRLANNMYMSKENTIGAISCLFITMALAYLYVAHIEPNIKRKYSC